VNNKDTKTIIEKPYINQNIKSSFIKFKSIQKPIAKKEDSKANKIADDHTG